jgi:Predicted ATPase
MTFDDLMLLCGICKVYPAKYDNGGWINLLLNVKKLGVDVDENIALVDSLPKSKKDIDSAVAEVRRKMATPNTLGWLCGINVDRFYALSEDKQEKEFSQFISTVEQLEFPPYVVELDPVIQNYITENFMYTYSKDGKAIVYVRVPESQGTIWEEVGDSEKPFTKVKGRIRSGLIDCLVIRSLSKVVTVFVNKDGAQKVYEHVPYWKLHKKHLEKTMTHIEGSQNLIEQFRGRLEGWIDMMKRSCEGRLRHTELQKGMQQIPVKLEELDTGIDNMTFFYRKEINLPTLTNDPNEPALAFFDLNNITEGPTPDFDGFMEAIEPSCRDTLMAAIYATFFAKSRLNQYVWIHGEGGDGKSSLLNAIATYAGDRLACSLGQTMNSDFGLEDAIGKRMVILSDVKTGLSVKSQLIHNLTGHDPVSVNRKNRPIITLRLNPIVWIAANEAPDVNFDNRNEARRCLYIKMCEPPIEVQKKFYFIDGKGEFVLDSEGRKINNGYDLEGGLLREMPHILFKCRQAFERVCPAPYSVIKPDTKALQLAEDNCVDIDAATFATYIQETFSFVNKEAKMLQTEIFEAMGETMKNHADKNNMNQFMKRDIRRLLTAKYGCQRKKINGIYYMTGIARKVNGMSPIPNPATGRPVFIPDPVQMPAQVGDFV